MTKQAEIKEKENPLENQNQQSVPVISNGPEKKIDNDLIRSRIARMKKAFRPTWLLSQIEKSNK